MAGPGVEHSAHLQAQGHPPPQLPDGGSGPDPSLLGLVGSGSRKNVLVQILCSYLPQGPLPVSQVEVLRGSDDPLL